MSSSARREEPVARANDAEVEVEVTIALPGGRVLTVRRAAPDDIEGLEGLYEALSIEDRYLRFFAPVRPHRSLIERFIGASDRGGIWLVAVTDEGEVVADAGYDLLPDGDAEFALTVAKAWRGWLGPFLLDLLVQHASRQGIRNLRGSILRENRTMLSLVRRRGYASVDDNDYTVQGVTISTAGGRPSWPPLHEQPRLLVEGCGGRWRGYEDARAAGWDIITCAGPGAASVPVCPLLEGGVCPLVEGADLVVLALPPSDPRSAALEDAHRLRSTRLPVPTAELSDEELSARLHAELECHRSRHFATTRRPPPRVGFLTPPGPPALVADPDRAR